MDRRKFIGATGAVVAATVAAVKPIQAITRGNKELFDVGDRDAVYIVCIKDPDLKTMREEDQMTYLLEAKKALAASGIRAIVTCEDIEIFKIEDSQKSPDAASNLNARLNTLEAEWKLAKKQAKESYEFANAVLNFSGKPL